MRNHSAARFHEPVARPPQNPVNDLEKALQRCVSSGARASLLRALARSNVCLLAAPASGVASGRVPVTCVSDADGRHALIYTSYEQLVAANNLGKHDPWVEVPAGELFAHWPQDVDVWLNVGSELEFRLSADEALTAAEVAAGLEVSAAYEIGPGDEISDFPGPSTPDEVDCAAVQALSEMAPVLEIVRIFRRLDEPAGRTWRILLVMVDQSVEHEPLATAVIDAVNDAADECCEVHVADVHDDDVFEAVSHILQIGVPLWRRDGLSIPDGIEGIEDLDIDGSPDEK
jgi:type III secretion system (T3SS) SseB-like protein